MTVAQFLAWSDRQPTGRYELQDGEVVAMAPEALRHVRAKGEVFLALRNAIRTAGVACEAFMDGVGIPIDDRTLYIPDASVNCGEPLDDQAQTLPAPVIVVEVVSPSSERRDAIQKFAGYFRLPSVQHYLLVDAAARMVMHHRKQPDGAARTSIQGSGPLTFDPPGITIQVEDLFPAG